MPNIEIDIMQTLAIGVLALWLGKFLKSKISILEKFCIPAPVIGGLIFALIHTILKSQSVMEFTLDTTLQKPFMMVFFTTIGFGASMTIVKKGGLGVVIFWALATVLCVFQDAIGVAIAKMVDIDPHLGLLCGSVSMTGGHGTAGAWGPKFAEMGVASAEVVGIAAATFGLIMGCLIGGPVARGLITKNKLKAGTADGSEYDASIFEQEKKPVNFDSIFTVLCICIVAIGLGSILEILNKKYIPGFTVPSYVYAMIFAAILRNTLDKDGDRFSNESIGIIGDISLNMFLAEALISLKLWELKDVAGSMMIILIAQTVFMMLFAFFVTYNIMGRDYDASVISAGHCGFGMGATPTAVANMQAVVERFGPAPRAFFILPVVGAFLIDFTNSIVITAFTKFL